MQHVFRTLRGFQWFLRQSVDVRGLGLPFFCIPAMLMAILLYYAFPKADTLTIARFAWLIPLPLIWLFIGLWGSYFWLDESKATGPNPVWANWPLRYGIYMFLAVAAAAVLRMRRGRIFTFLFAIANLYFVVAMTFLAGMAVHGIWL